MKARILNKWHSPGALFLARSQIVPWEAILTEYLGTEERWINDTRFSPSGFPIPKGGGFPNRASEYQSKCGLILQDLCYLHSRDGHSFVVIVHQKRTK